jgi:hypothetical protein
VVGAPFALYERTFCGLSDVILAVKLSIIKKINMRAYFLSMSYILINTLILFTAFFLENLLVLV